MCLSQLNVERESVNQREEARRLRCAVLVEARYLAQAQPSGLLSVLRERGHDAVVVDPEAWSVEAGDAGWFEGIDCLVARGRSWAVLSLLGWAEAAGIRTINRWHAVSLVHNKADQAVRLRAAGLPVPPTYFGSIPQLASRFRARDYPVILKPVFGDNGNGLRIVENRRELLALDWPEPVALAQKFIRNSGWDLKLYAIGDNVWAVRKPTPWAAPAEAVLLRVAPPWRELAHRCGALFGLDLFGVDCVETDAGPVIIEVNEFPNYSGVPAASERLADYVLARASKENPS